MYLLQKNESNTENRPLYCQLLADMKQVAPAQGDLLALTYNGALLASDMDQKTLGLIADGDGLIRPETVSLAHARCYVQQGTIYGNVFSVLLVRSQDSYLNSTILWIWSGCFLITLLLCVLVSYLNYRPVRKISTIVRSQHPNQRNRNESEYKAIETSLLAYERQVEGLSEKIRIQNEMFRGYYLEKLLLNQIPPRESIGDILSFFGMAFRRRQNFVCILEVDSSDHQIAMGSEIDMLEEHEVVMSLYELMRENLDVTEQLYLLQIDYRWVFVCSMRDSAGYRAEIGECLVKLSEDIQSRIELHMGFDVDCGERLWESYFDALRQTEGEAAAAEAQPEAAGRGAAPRTSYASQCIEIIHARYADEDLNAEALADACGVTLAYLSKLFKKEVGMGLLEYLQRYRIDCAKKQLAQDPDIRINVLCENVGYSNVATFIRVFKKYEGASPGAYRDQILKAGGGL